MSNAISADIAAGMEALAGVRVGATVAVFQATRGGPEHTPTVFVQDRVAKRTAGGLVLQGDAAQGRCWEKLTLLQAARDGWRLTAAAALTAALVQVTDELQRLEREQAALMVTQARVAAGLHRQDLERAARERPSDV